MSQLICKTLFVCTAGLLLASCGTTGKHKSHKPQTTARKVQPVRISHIDRTQGSQELMLHSMGLIGTPYKWGGSTTATGFDCSGMIQFVYKNALNVNLPRTARDMAAASRTISTRDLQTGDLVFFNTSGSGISHVGLYLGGGKFLNRIHKPAFPIRIAQTADKLLQCIGIFRQQVADQEDFAVARTEKTAV